jgi:hypothetical protein
MKKPRPSLTQQYRFATLNPTIWEAWIEHCDIFGEFDPRRAEVTKELNVRHYEAFHAFATEQRKLHQMLINA